MIEPLRPVGIAFVGCGSVMRGAYLPHARRLERAGIATVVGACDRTTRNKGLLESLGVDRFTTEVTELLEWEGVDVVVVATPVDTHCTLATASLEAGKHVLLEKPMATSFAEAQQLAAVAEQSAAELIVAPAVVLSDTFRRMRAHLELSDIGIVSLARAQYGWSGPDWSDWFYRPGGGPLRDLGVYCLTTLTGLLGPVATVHAMGGISQPHRAVNGVTTSVDVEDHFQVTVGFVSGALGVITTGFTMQQATAPSVEIYGSAGTLQMLGHDWAPDGYELWTNDAACWRRYPESQVGWPWTAGLDHVIDVARHTTTPMIAVDHAVHVAEIIEVALRSARSGHRGALTSSFTPVTVGLLDRVSDAHRRHDRGRES